MVKVGQVKMFGTNVSTRYIYNMWLICLYPLGDGTGVNVYVIDTGVSPDHVDFNGRCVAAYDAVGNTVSSAK